MKNKMAVTKTKLVETAMMRDSISIRRPGPAVNTLRHHLFDSVAPVFGIALCLSLLSVPEFSFVVALLAISILAM